MSKLTDSDPYSTDSYETIDPSSSSLNQFMGIITRFQGDFVEHKQYALGDITRHPCGTVKVFDGTNWFNTLVNNGPAGDLPGLGTKSYVDNIIINTTDVSTSVSHDPSVSLLGINDEGTHVQVSRNEALKMLGVDKILEKMERRIDDLEYELEILK